jgi:hypothetical protein
MLKDKNIIKKKDVLWKVLWTSNSNAWNAFVNMNEQFTKSILTFIMSLQMGLPKW